MDIIAKKGFMRSLSMFESTEFAIYFWNPFKNWFRFEKNGPIYYLFLPGIKVTWIRK